MLIHEAFNVAELAWKKAIVEHAKTKDANILKLRLADIIMTLVIELKKDETR